MINIICASYFDPLGHHLFANKIASNISDTHETSRRVKIYGVNIEVNKKNSNTEIDIVSIHIPFLGRFFNLDTRNILIKKFGIIGKIIFFAVRFLVCLIFYVKLYRQLSNNDMVVDLEFEPIQSAFASIFCNIPHKHVMVLHSFPKTYGRDLKSLYKLFTRSLLKYQLKKSSNNRLALMHTRAIAHAISQGFSEKQLVLAGWGFDLKNSNSKKKLKPMSAPVKILSFGVLRNDKRIAQLVRLFLELENRRLELNVIGKSFDVDVASLISEIHNFNSQTKVTINDRYIQEFEIATLFKDCDVVVISHNSSFDSASGPLAFAFEFKRPVLCFSSNFVAELVTISNFGVVVDMDSITKEELVRKILQLPNIKYDLDKIKHYEWCEIAKRLVSI